ncbi:MAG TPA: class I SAM-dependent methyltransferase [Terriglobales bacterium]|nr:class I SAM-dependent methyltransferase [Terriglobales bacterium]
MKVFEEYAGYYDALYADKDYAAETEYVLGLLRQQGCAPESLLELGCGTGVHAQHFAQAQVRVHGVDRSSAMLERACARLREMPEEIARHITFSRGDAREIRLSRMFDCAVSLFHVMSYQTGNDDLQNAFLTARQHLKPGGIFLFDCWYGPAVLAEKPEVRTKRWSNHEVSALRIAEPSLHVNENRVDVHYTLRVTCKRSGVTQEVHEVHSMRYLFRPEVEWFASRAGLQITEAREWLSQRPPGLNTWNVCFLARG